MENTTAFGVLMELIQVLGNFVTAPIFFNLSVIHILIISFLFNMVIGILLGGVSPRAIINHTHSPERSQVIETNVNLYDKVKGAKETYTGGGSY